MLLLLQNKLNSKCIKRIWKYPQGWIKTRFHSIIARVTEKWQYQNKPSKGCQNGKAFN